MKARTAAWVAIPVALVVALAVAFGAWMFWITSSAKTSWVVPAGYTASADGRSLTLYGWGGACDEPLWAKVLSQDESTVRVGVLRTEAAGSCTANAEVHQVDVSLVDPLADREVRDRSGAVVPVAASVDDVLRHPNQLGLGSG